MHSSQQPILSLIIPCYNEGENVSELITRLHVLHTQRQDIESILVDNGSSDSSVTMISDAANNYSFIRSVRVEKNEGYGWGILQGLNAAKGTFLGWTHADMQTDPNDVLHALHIIEKHNYTPSLYIKGKRIGRPLSDTFFTIGMSLFESILFAKKLWDINAQPNIFHRSFYEHWKNPPKDFSLDLYSYVTALRSNVHIIRFPVFFKQRLYGVSHWNRNWKSKYTFIKRTLDFSLKLRRFS